jgi:endo-1,4-beta-xylanase
LNAKWTRRELLLTSGALAATTMAATYASDAAPPLVPNVGSDGLRKRAEKKGLLVGSEVEMPDLARDAKLEAVLREDANIIVPGISLKWQHIQPTQTGPLQFQEPEAIYAFAKANDMKMRGHCLTWWQEEPKWAQALIPTLTPGQAGDMLQRYIHDVVSHWRGRVVQWDVVNEPISAQDKLLETLWSGKLGEQYIDLAYQAAREADPDAMLVLNHDYIAQEDWWQRAQRAATVRLLERLNKRNVPIDCFGIEGHLLLDKGFSETNWRAFCETVTGLGHNIMITEFDVNDQSVAGDIPTRDAAVCAMAKPFLDVTLSFPQTKGLLTWGETDRYSWMLKDPSHKRADGLPPRGMPRDDQYARKPLWNVIANAIDHAPAR